MPKAISRLFLFILLSASLLHSSEMKSSVWEGLSFDPTKPFPSEFLTGSEDVLRTLPRLLADDTLNIKINSDTVSDIHNEEQVWINPTNENNLVAVWRDFRLHYRRVGVGYSFDGGKTWTDTLFDKPSYDWRSDPGLTVDSEGNFYSIFIYYTPDLENSGLFVLKSSDGGMTWSDPITVVDSVVGVFEDKELIACDRTLEETDGNLYVSWARYNGSGLQIHCASSLDRGLSFEQEASFTALSMYSMMSGIHSLSWDGKCDNGVLIHSGIYLYRLVTGKQVLTRKMVLLR